ncbi:MAG: entericidin A/B family lipoprotein [Silicimonas sp.]|nr:entericidin A/B family lipoprotein [Silicimonas sp.]NND41016.1 entericidin A/B family lipoprotein [Silicimonas sp.]NNL74612.1 entericidin A/B family lipoprotein [Silicimonas sp.]
MLLRMIIVSAAFALAACETVDGFGQDVSTGGQAIQNASQEVQEDL